MNAAMVRAIVCGSAALALSACSARHDIQKPLALEPMALAAAPNISSEPQLTVNGDRAILSWVENTDDSAVLKVAERTGSGWSEPLVAARGKGWFLSWADVPAVMRVDDGTLVAQWLLATDLPAEAYDVRLAFSHDGGRTWSPPVSPHHDGTKTQHGFVSMYQAPAGALGLVWLDGRAVDPSTGDGPMSVRAAMFTRDGAESSESLVDDRVCDCCPTSIAVAAGGPVAAFRDRSAKEVRDIAVSRLVNGAWTPSALVHDDGWTINACPVNGPAIAARGHDVAVAWFTAKNDEGHAFAAFSHDDGATFGAPIRLDEASSLGRVSIAMADEDAVATWIEFANGHGEVKLRRVDASGARGPAQTVAGFTRDEASGIPRVVRAGSDLVFAWTEASRGNSTVKTAAAHLR
jgi:hypothetical protein